MGHVDVQNRRKGIRQTGTDVSPPDSHRAGVLLSGADPGPALDGKGDAAREFCSSLNAARD